jgi:hypothetical protein
MQSTDLEEIKAALWEQSHHPCTRVKWGMAQVMAVRKSKKGHLQALLRGWGRWCPIETVTIERPLVCPTGARDIEDATGCATWN